MPTTRGRPDETEEERADRNFGDLLQELRVGQTGVQVLFGFLLTMPVQQRFSRFDDFQTPLLVLDVLILATASSFMIAPVAWHRVMFRRRMKDEVVLAANHLAQAGLFFLGLGVVVSILARGRPGDQSSDGLRLRRLDRRPHRPLGALRCGDDRHRQMHDHQRALRLSLTYDHDPSFDPPSTMTTSTMTTSTRLHKREDLHGRSGTQ